jgi:hypothetical protein
LRGTVPNTSRVTDVMIGVIITARITPAVRKQRPVCDPGKTSAIFGAKTRMPHRPKTTDGTAARSSTIAVSVPRARVGHSSVM